jgi:hypothetical protein
MSGKTAPDIFNTGGWAGPTPVLMQRSKEKSLHPAGILNPFIQKDM